MKNENAFFQVYPRRDLSRAHRPHLSTFLVQLQSCEPRTGDWKPKGTNSEDSNRESNRESRREKLQITLRATLLVEHMDSKQASRCGFWSGTIL